MGNDFWTLDHREGLKCEFYGLSSDVDKLPKDPEFIGSGSIAYCIDTGELYMFHQPSLTWHLQ